jgi:hypothetical protein
VSQTFRIPFPFRPYTGGSPEVPVEGTTAGELLLSLCAACPGLRRHLYANTGGLRGTIHLFVDGREVAGPEEEVGPATMIELVPSIMGGGTRNVG